MTIQTVRAPYAQPISLAEAKAHLRLATDAQDTLIASWIVAATRTAEHQTQRQLIGARLRLSLDAWPCEQIVIARAPLLRVVSIQYVDPAGEMQTLASDSYSVDLDAEPARITQLAGCWPALRRQSGAVKIVFDAGHAAPITADINTDTITVRGWIDLAVGNSLRLSNSGGKLPTPLQPDTDYYVQQVVEPGVYQLSATVGGAAIDITASGTGQSYLGVVPEDAKAWMLLRLGALDANREEVGPKLELISMPFVDRLLDGLKVYG